MMRGFLSVHIQSLLAPIPAKALFHNIHFVGNLNIIFHIVFCRQTSYIHIRGRILLSVTRQWPQVANALHLLTPFRKLCRLISALEVPWVCGENMGKWCLHKSFSQSNCCFGVETSTYPTLPDGFDWWSPVTGHPTGHIPRILHSLFEANHWMITWLASFYESKLVNIKVIGVKNACTWSHDIPCFVLFRNGFLQEPRTLAGKLPKPSKISQQKVIPWSQLDGWSMLISFLY